MDWKLLANQVVIDTGSNDNMTYDELADVIAHRMRLSHIYQPLLVPPLLDTAGVCSGALDG